MMMMFEKKNREEMLYVFCLFFLPISRGIVPGHHGVTNSQHRAYGNLPKRVFRFPAPHRTQYVPLLHQFSLLFFRSTHVIFPIFLSDIFERKMGKKK